MDIDYKNSVDTKFKDLIRDIHENGVYDSDKIVRAKYADGSPAYSKSVFGRQVVFEEGEIPLITCKKMFPITAIKEMFLFWVKQTVKKEDFDSINCKVWDEWMFTEGEFKGTIGKSYAYQFTSSDGERNQVKELIYNIINNPSSKRLMTSFWNYNDVKDKALQECAMQTTWHVREDKLDLLLYSRSADIGLGVAFNWFQYKILQMWIAHCTGYKPGRFIHQIGNLHYYDRHEQPLLDLLDYKEYEPSTVELTINHTNFFDIDFKDTVITNYQSGPYIPLEVAI